MEGSFWTAFGVKFGPQTQASIDDILEKPNFTLEELLDHEDVIQDCKYLNSPLIDYLSQPETLAKLIGYVVTVPPQAAHEAISIPDSKNHALHRSASNSSPPAKKPDSPEKSKEKEKADGEKGKKTDEKEKGKEEVGGKDGEKKAEGEKEGTRNGQGGGDGAKEQSAAAVEFPNSYPYLASELFACEVVSMLDALFEHPHLLQRLFSFLDQTPPLDPSVAGYFRKVVVVLIQRKYEQLVKYIHEQNLIQKLVDHIGLYSVMELLIMIGWDDGLGQLNDVEWLHQQNLIPKLVAKLDPKFESEEEVQINAARALVDVVVKCPPQQESTLVTHLQSPQCLEKIFSYLFSGSLTSLTNCLSIVIVLVQRDATRRVELPEEEHVKWEPPFIIEQVIKHLDKFAALLTNKPRGKESLEMPTQYGSLNPPLGETRMKAVELFLVLVRSNYSEVNEKLAKLNVVSSILDLFFMYPWNNMLHGLVESILHTIRESDSDVMKKSLFEGANFVDRVLQAYEVNKQAEAKNKGFRLGYMGHLVRMCGAVEFALQQDEDVKLQELMAPKRKEWKVFVEGPLRLDNEAHHAVLGGIPPSRNADVEEFEQGEEEFHFPVDEDDDSMAFDRNPGFRMDDDEELSQPAWQHIYATGEDDDSSDDEMDTHNQAASSHSSDEEDDLDQYEGDGVTKAKPPTRAKPRVKNSSPTPEAAGAASAATNQTPDWASFDD